MLNQSDNTMSTNNWEIALERIFDLAKSHQIILYDNSNKLDFQGNILQLLKLYLGYRTSKIRQSKIEFFSINVYFSSLKDK